MANSSVRHKSAEFVPVLRPPSPALVVPIRWDGPAAGRNFREFEQPVQPSIAVYCRRGAAVLLAWLGIAAISGHLLAGVLVLAAIIALFAAACAWGMWALDNTLEL